MRRVVAIVGSIAGALGATLALAQEEAPVRPFPEAVQALVQQVKEAAPPRVRVDVEETTVAALGWRAARERCPARVLTIMTPSGAARAFGLLPREGSYAPDPGRAQALVTIGPDLVIVRAPLAPAALTLEQMQAAQPLLDQAAAPVAALDQPLGPVVDVSGFTRGEVALDETHPHYLALEVAAGGAIDLEAAWRAGQRAIAWRVRGPEGWTPPTIAIRPR